MLVLIAVVETLVVTGVLIAVSRWGRKDTNWRM